MTASDVVLAKLVLGDLLDDGILGARPDDDAFPLRLVLGAVGERLEHDDGFLLATALNFFFRGDMADEDRAVLGHEASRTFYRFAHTAALDPAVRARAAPLLAALFSSQVTRLRFESIDHLTTFDSSIHERDEGSNGTSARILEPASFLCRVAATGAVKMKARVLT